MGKILIISEGGAGFPVVEKTDDPSPRRIAYVDSAFLNVATSLLIADRLRREHQVIIRFGVQYFTSANQYHIPESFERKYEERYRESPILNREDIAKIFHEMSLNEESIIKLTVLLSIFEAYLKLTQTKYTINGSSNEIISAYNHMGKLQILSHDSPIKSENLGMEFGNANQNTVLLIKHLEKVFGIERVDIQYDQGPRLETNPDLILSLLSGDLKQARSRLASKLEHVLSFFYAIGYNPSLDYLPFTIPYQGEYYNGVRYMFTDKDKVKVVRTYTGLGRPYYKRPIDREELIKNIKSASIYFTFPFAVFEGEMIKPVKDSEQLIDKDQFKRWLSENEEEAKKYDKIIVIEGIEGEKGSEHTIGLREKIIKHIAGSKYVRIYSPVSLENGDIKRLDEFEIEGDNYETQFKNILRYLETMIRQWIDKII